jgi:hypothetical protein
MHLGRVFAATLSKSFPCINQEQNRSRKAVLLLAKKTTTTAATVAASLERELPSLCPIETPLKSILLRNRIGLL